MNQASIDVVVDSILLWAHNPLTYKKAGVDIEKGNEFVGFIKSLDQTTKKKIGDFDWRY